MRLSLDYEGGYIRAERRYFSISLSRIIEILIKLILIRKINKIATILISYFFASSSEEVN